MMRFYPFFGRQLNTWNGRASQEHLGRGICPFPLAFAGAQIGMGMALGFCAFIRMDNKMVE
jgi:hypothetical protein